MSSIVIAGDTSGSVTLAAPAVAGSTVITLPSTSTTLVSSQWTTTGSDIYYTTGNVGIGTTSPGGYKLAIGDGSSNRGRIMLKGATSGNYPEINIDDTMNSGGKNYQVYSTGGVLKVVNSTDSNVSFVANGAGIGLGDNAPVDGDGIRFPATQSASTDANTLDDYEEGTWTPSLGGTATYTTQSGRYTKVGALVHVSINLVVTSIGTGTTTTMSGLPFTPVGNTQAGYTNWFFSIASNQIYIFPRVIPSDTTIYFAGIQSSTTQVNNSPTIFGSSAQIEFSIVYRAS